MFSSSLNSSQDNEENEEEGEFMRLLPFIGFFLTYWEKIQRWWKKLRNSSKAQPTMELEMIQEEEEEDM